MPLLYRPQLVWNPMFSPCIFSALQNRWHKELCLGGYIEVCLNVTLSYEAFLITKPLIFIPRGFPNNSGNSFVFSFFWKPWNSFLFAWWLTGCTIGRQVLKLNSTEQVYNIPRPACFPVCLSFSLVCFVRSNDKFKILKSGSKSWLFLRQTPESCSGVRSTA